MIISMIVAVSENGVIGKDGQIPWRLPEDLKLFKQVTMGHHLVVGRKTFESIGRPLPGRTMVVLSHQPDFEADVCQPPGCQTARSLSAAFEIARKAGEDEVFVGGGAGVYAQALPIANRIYLSQVHVKVDGDTFFPEMEMGNWREELTHDYPAGPNGEPGFTYKILVSR